MFVEYCIFSLRFTIFMVVILMMCCFYGQIFRLYVMCIFQGSTMVILCLLVFLSVNPVLGFLCDKSAQVCETFLYIDHYLTMFNYNARAVYPKNGKLYRYNVTNTSAADPIPLEDVITGDDWEARRLLVVANYTLPGPDIIVHEGQTVVIHVKNLLHSNTVTIHWHGLHQVELHMLTASNSYHNVQLNQDKRLRTDSRLSQQAPFGITLTLALNESTDS